MKYNWILTRDASGNAEYIMRAGKDNVKHHMPYDKAMKLCKGAEIAVSGDKEYPIQAGVFSFKGEIEEWREETFEKPSKGRRKAVEAVQDEHTEE